MKTTIRTIILAVTAIFAAMSCNKEKEFPGVQDQIKAGETIHVSINATLNDLVAADGTKATAESVVRLKWATGDKVQAYCGSTKISSGDGITVTPSENGMFASLTGDITAPESGKTITFIYSSGCTADGLTFDLSSQSRANGIPFVAYGTLVYDGSAITDKTVEFKFGTSIMKIVAMNLGGGALSGATISGINNKFTVTPKEDGMPVIAGTDAGSISTDNIDAPSDGTKAIITVGLVPDNNTSRNITVSQTGYINKGVITSAAIASSKSYTTPTSLFPCGTKDGHDFVLIAGTKWATQNLAVSASGNKKWKGNNSSAVKVPGKDEDVIVGDYFQWAAYVNYTTETNSDKGLLIYESFNNTKCVGGAGTNSFTFKADKEFYITSAPYAEGLAYSQYNTNKPSTLASSDDVAYILWQGSWRMPTSAEFKAMKEATFWKWNSNDSGYYVYAPQTGDAGRINDSSSTYSPSSALLFLPAGGNGNRKSFAGQPGNIGYYWSKSLDFATAAYSLYFNSYSFQLKEEYRFIGFSVRPVSD